MSLPCLNKVILSYPILINVKLEAGGGGVYVGHLTSIAFPTLGNLTKNLGPKVGRFAFCAQRKGTKSHHPMCSSVHWPSSGIEVVWLKP